MKIKDLLEALSGLDPECWITAGTIERDSAFNLVKVNRYADPNGVVRSVDIVLTQEGIMLFSGDNTGEY